MSRRLLLAVALAASPAIAAMQVGVDDRGARPVADVLRAASAYIAEYERQVSAVVSEELYVQRSTDEWSHTSDTRRLRSDVLTIPDAKGGWVGFRDVFEVDGKLVRDRDERLAKLFLQPHADAVPQAKRIADESARFNLAAQVSRTINTPLLALLFIRAGNQGRSTFKADGIKPVNGVGAMVLRFEERTKPRIVHTIDDAAASGRFWIDPASGRIVQTELFIDTWRGQLTSLIRVAYADQPNVGVWLPVTMNELYRSGTLTITGQAEYSRFRKFTVDTSVVLKAP